MHGAYLPAPAKTRRKRRFWTVFVRRQRHQAVASVLPPPGLRVWVGGAAAGGGRGSATSLHRELTSCRGRLKPVERWKQPVDHFLPLAESTTASITRVYE